MSLCDDEGKVFGTELQADTLDIVCNGTSWELDIFGSKNLGFENGMNSSSEFGSLGVPEKQVRCPCQISNPRS